METGFDGQINAANMCGQWSYLVIFSEKDGIHSFHMLAKTFQPDFLLKAINHFGQVYLTLW